MADFRKVFYALAVVALLAVVTVPASAQGMSCSQPIGDNAAIRQGGFTEMAGDFVIRCQDEIQGVSTPATIAVKQGTLRLKVLNTTFTSKKVATIGGVTMVESLLLIDNPGQFPVAGFYQPSGANYNGQFACGTNATDNSVNGPGVCSITSTGNPDQTYDGTVGSGYTNGRPNIYQARWVDNSTIDFVGVPLDPPGTNKVRVFRFVNNRVNAGNLAVGIKVSFELTIVNSQTSFALPNVKTAEVGTVVERGPLTSIVPNQYTICVTEINSPAGAITVTEGSGQETAANWRTRNTVQHVLNATNYGLNQFIYGGDGTTTGIATTTSPADVRQDYPLGGYFTESGFVFDPAYQGGSAWSALPNGLASAGRATTGTHITFPIGPVPTGTSVSFPSFVALTGPNGTTGFMYLLPQPYTTSTQVSYEIGFANPFVVETATIVPRITYFALITGPQQMNAGNAVLSPFAPAFTNTTWPEFNTSLGLADHAIVNINNCQCSLLFPWVVSNASYATGIAVSNTSKDPTNAGLTSGYTAVQQNGVVRLYLFGTNSAGTSTVATLNSTSGVIASGTSATFVLSGISGGFQGYAITQSDFQYCHGAAFLFNTGAGVPPMSYLGLVMDHSPIPFVNIGLGNFSIPAIGRLPRTTQLTADELDN